MFLSSALGRLFLSWDLPQLMNNWLNAFLLFLHHCNTCIDKGVFYVNWFTVYEYELGMSHAYVLDMCAWLIICLRFSNHKSVFGFTKQPQVLLCVVQHSQMCTCFCAVLMNKGQCDYSTGTGNQLALCQAFCCWYMRAALVYVARIACLQRIMRSQPVHLPASAFSGRGVY